METIKSYLLSVTAAAIICGAILTLTAKKETSSTMIRLLTGIFMTYTILSPLIDINPGHLEYISEGIITDAEDAVSMGKKIAFEEASEYINSTLEAYILDKASALGVKLDVNVSYNNENGTTNRVVLHGDVSPYAKEVLASYITDELGIPREDQNWQE